MSYDMDMCDGITYGDGICPIRDSCKRYVFGQKALSEKYYPIWWLNPAPYEDGRCELKIKIEDEKETEKNG